MGVDKKKWVTRTRPERLRAPNEFAVYGSKSSSEWKAPKKSEFLPDRKFGHQTKFGKKMSWNWANANK